MTDFLKALKDDFLDRRLLPFIALVVVALAAAVGYVALDSGSSTSTPPAASPAVSAQTGATHLAVSQVTPEKATAEVPTGTSTQHEGYARNPFAPVVTTSTTSKSASSSTAAASSPTTTSSGTTTSASSGTSSEPSKEPTTTKPSKPKPKTVYHVAALFGLVPAGGATQTALTPFVNIPLLTPLPSTQEPLVVFRGVTIGGKSATFTVVGEVILHGSATCLPSEQQCEAIDLQAGKSETLEYIPASGPAQLYELKIVSIAAGKASTASVKSVLRNESKAGRELLRRSGLVAIPDLHYSTQVGVLAFVSHKAFAARAHGARRR
jgi:hypothetical protein